MSLGGFEMTANSELFWQASLQEIKQGYKYQAQGDEFVCLICGRSFPNGLIYSSHDQLYEARRFIQVHIEDSHGSAFHYLLNLDKKVTGLTDHQKAILELFYQGKGDSEVAHTLNTGSTSTIRNHRFTLREKQKQAKIFLAIMELLAERGTRKTDNRFAGTEQENDRILKTYFKLGLDGPLDSYPTKEKKRMAILRHLVKQFEVDRTYSEKEVNAILRQFFDDYVMLRRHLIEYGFMERTQDGGSYWVRP
jgi:DNA-binding CsgD family transcriptional regulator